VPSALRRRKADHGPVEIVRVRIADSRTFAISRQGHKGASGKVSLATFRRVKELIMKLKFCGHLVSLKEQLKACRVRGEWRYIEKNSLYQFKAETGENLNWWPSTGTITFQGGDKPILAKRFARGVAQ